MQLRQYPFRTRILQLIESAITSVADLNGQFSQFRLENRLFLIVALFFFDGSIATWTSGSFPIVLRVRFIVASGTVRRMAVVADIALLDIT